MESCWSWLPDLVLEAILTKLNPLSGDYFRFGAVCKEWYKIMKKNKSLVRSATQIPLLMIPSKNKVKSRRSFYDLTNSRRYDSLHSLVPYTIKACGSSCGWLIFLEKTMQIVLYNPFVKHSRKNRADIGVIKLPPVMSTPNATSYQYSVYKVVVLFGNPSLTQDYAVAAIYSATNSLAIWKASSGAEKKWIYLEDVGKDLVVDRDYTDVIEHNSLIYAVSATMGVISIDPFSRAGNNGIVVKEIIRWPFIFRTPTYLAESSKGKLFIIRRIKELGDYYWHNTLKFEVYRLKDDFENSMEMEKVDSLDGDTIFVGDGKSVCVAASDFRNCEPNSVYFTDDGFMLPSRYGEVHWGPRDTGVFCLEDDSIKPHYPYDDSTQKFLPPAIWVTPMF
ncbi:hypothetical protein RND81_06G138100 [Saponaria officinalis]|uniref:F-box domain-containing protein n=1 Tax=Saponaria officinalis TaxID=3572 RepID=A0AAW1KB31_SAPOF